ncbi:astacin-like metalloprotease toxin 1 [Trichonephila inaurata madagascariensis]|uniref:Metalloendopeptidase n=1 Tax=Trichonephila inaurata madagascariensis TaxID=2747483 RepID=A0A8X6XIP4_9ARAC|nr:astacin-like metalloprotease toxin 1 [Trichonephila inaurata madagascariensis]
MLWKLLVAFIALYTSPVQDSEHETIHYGPKNSYEAHLAHYALHGEHEEMIPNPSGAGIKDNSTRWPGFPGKAVIPYVMDKSLDLYEDLFKEAFDQYHRHTCIRFVKRTHEKDYVRIIKGPGCYSFVGKVGGLQVLSIGRGCEYLGTIVHELGHVIGFYHEHQRSDRNNYINVYEKNIVKGKEHNFRRTDINYEKIFTKYDHNSIMHYGSYAFSKKPGQLKTMEAKDGSLLLEPYDKKGLNKMGHRKGEGDVSMSIEATNLVREC